MYEEISAALTSAKAFLDIVKATKELQNKSDIIEITNRLGWQLADAQLKLFQANENALSVQQRVTDLTEKINRIEDFELQKGNYSMINLPSGMIVYETKQAHDKGELPHYACTACMGKREVAILQPVKMGTMTTYVCQSCGANIR